MRSGGEILIDGLIKHGATHLFCVPGESYLAALDALFDRQDHIHVITCRQEGGAAYASEAYGKLTGKPGICFVSRGPGASNAMIGLHTASQDSTPLLLFVGQIARNDVGREAFQEMDMQKVYSSIAKKVITINDAKRIPEQLAAAWHCATNGRPGPVVVEIPEDMLVDKVEVADVEPTTVYPAMPSDTSMKLFADLLADAKNPVVICGGAAWTPKASEFLHEFIEKQNLPVVATFRRNDSFNNIHPNYIGELGIAPNPKLLELIKQFDLLIAVAPRLGDMTTSGYTILDVPNLGSKNLSQKLIHVHVDPNEINSVYRADLGIVSHPECFLSAACEIVQRNVDRSKLIRQGHDNYLAFLTEEKNPGAELRMDKVSEYLRSRLTEDAIITVGAGNFTVWGQRFYQFRQPRTQLGSTNGSMGYGVPAALAAKLVRPNSTVVSFSGDGCFLMNGQELATAVQYNLNIIFLVVNNNCYGTIRSHQQLHYPERAVATYLNNPDFSALAKSYGAFGAVVTKTNQFESIFDEAMVANKPTVIELRTNY